MKKPNLTRGAVLLAALAVAGCPADVPEPPPAVDDTAPPAAPPPEAPGVLPNWYRMQDNRVELDVVAGATPDLNYWNFNGGTNGNLVITVPVGSEVTINFRNDDPSTPHSIGVAPFTATPPAVPAAEPVFPGAISENPTSMTESTMPGESETVTFTAAQAGEYALLCYIPGHGTAGMWVRFNVGDEASVSGTPIIDVN